MIFSIYYQPLQKYEMLKSASAAWQSIPSPSSPDHNYQTDHSQRSCYTCNCSIEFLLIVVEPHPRTGRHDECNALLFRNISCTVGCRYNDFLNLCIFLQCIFQFTGCRFNDSSSARYSTLSITSFSSAPLTTLIFSRSISLLSK